MHSFKQVLHIDIDSPLKRPPFKGGFSFARCATIRTLNYGVMVQHGGLRKGMPPRLACRPSPSIVKGLPETTKDSVFP